MTDRQILEIYTLANREEPDEEPEEPETPEETEWLLREMMTEMGFDEAYIDHCVAEQIYGTGTIQQTESEQDRLP